MGDRVLIVEDEARLREILCDYFAAKGEEPVGAENGQAALEYLQDHTVDAVLLDILMPELDGFTVCRAVRKNSSVPIIFLTALSDEDDKLRGYELGADDISNAVIVGAGQLGRALLSYTNYSEYGVDVIAAFDSDESLVGREIGGRPILSIKRMSSLCRRMKVHIGIITVPAPHAQEVCDKLLEGGIQAIWNFAPVHLKVPDNIIVKNEIIAVSLGELSRQLQEKRSGN